MSTPTHVLYRCRRCQCDEALEVPRPSVYIRESVEHSVTIRVHDCADGAQGVADLIGSGPGKALASKYEADSEDEA